MVGYTEHSSIETGADTLTGGASNGSTSRIWKSVAVALVLMLASVLSATAQTEPEEPPSEGTVTPTPEEPDTRHRVLAEIIVNAQKLRQSLLDVPLTVQVLSGEELRELATENLEVLTDNLPAVMVSKSAFSQRINIRGIGSGSNEGFEQSVGMFIDGIYLAQGRHLRPKLFDLEQVELLRARSPLSSASTLRPAPSTTPPRAHQRPLRDMPAFSSARTVRPRSN